MGVNEGHTKPEFVDLQNSFEKGGQMVKIKNFHTLYFEINILKNMANLEF